MKAFLLALLLLAPGEAKPLQIVTRQEWGSKPQALGEELRHQPDRVVLHHAGVVWKESDEALKKIRGLQSWGQREKGWPDLPYHFLIAPDGTVYEGRPLEFRPESNTDYDLEGVVNVHLWGHLDEQSVWPAQLEATVRLLASLPYEDVSAHRLEAPGQTTCPGNHLMKYLESGLLEKWVEQLRNGIEPDWQEARE